MKRILSILMAFMLITTMAVGMNSVPVNAAAKKKKAVKKINHYVIKPDVLSYTPKRNKKYIKKAIDGIFAHKTKIRLSDSWDDNLQIWSAIKGSPYFFIVSDCDLDKTHKYLVIKYKYNAKSSKKKLAYIDKQYLKFLNQIIKPGMSDLEKVLAVYQYFGKRIEYDYGWYMDYQEAQDKYALPDIAVYEALKKNSGVCHSYTYCCQFALQQLGIDCIGVTADMTENPAEGHMWAVIKLNGLYYHMDVTWDDNGDHVGLKYFGMTDAQNRARGVEDYHTSYDMSYGYIKCNDQRFKSWHDVTDYKLNGNGTVTLYRDNKKQETIDISGKDKSRKKVRNYSFTGKYYNHDITGDDKADAISFGGTKKAGGYYTSLYVMVNGKKAELKPSKKNKPVKDITVQIITKKNGKRYVKVKAKSKDGDNPYKAMYQYKKKAFVKVKG